MQCLHHVSASRDRGDVMTGSNGIGTLIQTSWVSRLAMLLTSS